MRLLPALAFAALLAPLAASAQPSAALSGDALTRLINDGQVWCAGWRDSDQSCDEVVFMEVADGKVAQTRRYRISDEVDFEMVIRQTLKVDGSRLCWTYRFEEMDVAVLNDGARAPAAQATVTIAMIRERMTDLEGKVACESYTRDAATGELSMTATLDGERAPDLDNRFKLLSPDSRVKLRALLETTEDAIAT